MALKNLFKKREPTEEEVRSDLRAAGISTRSDGGRQEQFSDFKVYASERNKAIQSHLMSKGGNPYAQANKTSINPYGQTGGNETQQINPYGSGNSTNNYTYGTTNDNSNKVSRSSSYNSNSNSKERTEPYGKTKRSNSDPYSTPSTRSYPDGKQNCNNEDFSSCSTSQSYSRSPPVRSNTDPYGTPTAHSIQGLKIRKGSVDSNSITLDSKTSLKKRPSRKAPKDMQGLDLNDPTGDEIDLNVVEFRDNGSSPNDHEGDPEERAVDDTKQEIKFIKKESAASTRKTLSMAQQADASAINTMGVLGSQSERIYQAEQNLLLAETQSKIANQKANELQRLNRSIFIPAYGSPFNKKTKLRQQEEMFRNAKMEELSKKDENRKEMYNSEQRLKSGMNNANSMGEMNYKGARNHHQISRYQFEDDSEDDDIEDEIAGNLDQIDLFTRKLNTSAKTIGQEVDVQNKRLAVLEEYAEKVDVDVNRNTNKLSNIH
ncbi:uncharacterized protein RJT20DRAFT_5295 [Scheffersomyces xylosifermentans]|uniref:uncharacterized protein n=1 Tax=Scheffersomyces xylosifermentans TaxID=1304137 RepID=UPI00315DD3DA